jgi:hypothetical protein
MSVGEAKALKVTSHVARDLLQSAALFSHEHQVVWEYVSNGLEYIDPGVAPFVDVSIDVKERRIVVADNGRGMTQADLERYFQMHSENIDRKRGKAGRGMFGTGKSAAFGIGDLLRLTTVRDGLRNTVELRRSDIDVEKHTDGIPLRVLEENAPVKAPNGTVVAVEGIHLKKMDVPGVIRQIERHIAHWPNATVMVNHQECKVSEPAYSEARTFTTVGSAWEASLGNAELTIKIAKAPLEQEQQGVAVVSGGVWHATTLAGLEGKPFSNYIFGKVDVPALAEDKSPIAPFDMSRSMKLNAKNALVQQLLGFLGANIDAVRRELELREQERKKDRDAKRLVEEANEIAKIINRDFDDWRTTVQKTLAKAPGGADRLAQGANAPERGESLSEGGEIPAIIAAPTGGEGGGNGDGSGDDKKSATLKPKLEPAGDVPAQAQAHESRKAKTGTSGGFRVDFRAMGSEEARASYKREERTIYINLDHPQIEAAKGVGGIEDVAFRRLSYEVAFAEYSIALASELAGSDWYHDLTDPIVDIRQTLNRLSRSAASLYSKN